MARKRLGDLLLERKAITPQQLATALDFQRRSGGRLGNALVAKGFLTESALCATLGEALGLPVLETVELKEWSALHVLRAPFCERHELFPVSVEDGRSGRRHLTVAMADPLDLPAIEQIEFTTGCKVQPVLAPRTAIRTAILRYYHRQELGRSQKGGDSGRMTLVRPGGEEEVVDTHSKKRPPPLKPHDAADDEPLPLTEEVTSRTELSEFIRSREKAIKGRPPATGQLHDDLNFLLGTEDPQTERLDDLERRFWALMRLMARKGLISKEEFQDEFNE